MFGYFGDELSKADCNSNHIGLEHKVEAKDSIKNTCKMQKYSQTHLIRR